MMPPASFDWAVRGRRHFESNELISCRSIKIRCTAQSRKRSISLARNSPVADCGDIGAHSRRSPEHGRVERFWASLIRLVGVALESTQTMEWLMSLGALLAMRVYTWQMQRLSVRRWA